MVSQARATWGRFDFYSRNIAFYFPFGNCLRKAQPSYVLSGQISAGPNWRVIPIERRASLLEAGSVLELKQSIAPEGRNKKLVHQHDEVAGRNMHSRVHKLDV